MARFQASTRSGRRNAVTEDELLPATALLTQYASQATDSRVADSRVADSGVTACNLTESHVADSRIAACSLADNSNSDATSVTSIQTTETNTASLPADLSQLKFDGEDW